MIKIEAVTLEGAFNDAAAALDCSVTQLAVEVVQAPSSGFLGLFKKKAIIVATIKNEPAPVNQKEKAEAEKESPKNIVEEEIVPTHTILNDTIMRLLL